MTSTREQHLDYAAVLQTIREWPVEERLALMHDILRTLPESDTQTPAGSGKRTWEQARGLLDGPWPTPSDEDVERLIEEYRAEKYGIPL